MDNFCLFSPGEERQDGRTEMVPVSTANALAARDSQHLHSYGDDRDASSPVPEVVDVFRSDRLFFCLSLFRNYYLFYLCPTQVSPKAEQWMISFHFHFPLYSRWKENLSFGLLFFPNFSLNRFLTTVDTFSLAVFNILERKHNLSVAEKSVCQILSGFWVGWVVCLLVTCAGMQEIVGCIPSNASFVYFIDYFHKKM